VAMILPDRTPFGFPNLVGQFTYALFMCIHRKVLFQSGI
jgi:hypothetical protein